MVGSWVFCGGWEASGGGGGGGYLEECVAKFSISTFFQYMCPEQRQKLETEGRIKGGTHNVAGTGTSDAGRIGEFEAMKARNEAMNGAEVRG